MSNIAAAQHASEPARSSLWQGSAFSTLPYGGLCPLADNLLGVWRGTRNTSLKNHYKPSSLLTKPQKIRVTDSYKEHRAQAESPTHTSLGINELATKRSIQRKLNVWIPSNNRLHRIKLFLVVDWLLSNTIWLYRFDNEILKTIIFSALNPSFPPHHHRHHRQFIITLTASWSCNGPLLSGILPITSLISILLCWRKWVSGAGHSRVLNTFNLNTPSACRLTP